MGDSLNQAYLVRAHCRPSVERGDGLGEELERPRDASWPFWFRRVDNVPPASGDRRAPACRREYGVLNGFDLRRQDIHLKWVARRVQRAEEGVFKLGAYVLRRYVAT